MYKEKKFHVENQTIKKVLVTLKRLLSNIQRNESREPEVRELRNEPVTESGRETRHRDRNFDK